LPNLIDIQRESFDWFLSEGLRETIDDISPIEDYTGTLAVEFVEYEFGQPQFSIQECREKDLTYQAPLSMMVCFVNKETGEILELFGSSAFIHNTIEKDTTTREEEALIEVFKKQRPGEPPTLDNARNLLRSLFFDPKRYDLTKVGRYKLNQRLGVKVPEDTRV